MKAPFTLEQQSDCSDITSSTVLQLALQIKQAALQARAYDLDLCVKQIGCDNSLGESIAKVTQDALKEANVSVNCNWIPHTHDFSGSLLLLNEHWGAAFSSAPSVCPEGMSLKLNDLALKRGDLDKLFTVTPVPADEALHAIVTSNKALV